MLYLSLLIAHHKFYESFYMRLDEGIQPFINIFRRDDDGGGGWMD